MYEVNEGRRAEYFRPHVNGEVIPLSRTGGGGGGTVINFAPVINGGNRAEIMSALKQAFPAFKQAVLQDVVSGLRRPGAMRGAVRGAI